MTSEPLVLLRPDVPPADELVPFREGIDENARYTHLGALRLERESPLAEMLPTAGGQTLVAARTCDRTPRRGATALPAS